jgi:dTDP-4-dehydrorhamnose reductase
MTLLLLGADGQVGWELRRALAPLGPLVALTREASTNPDGLCGDLENAEGLSATVAAVKPAWIINAAAYTAVDKAESEPDRAHRINAVAPRLLARLSAQHDAWLVHYSTDYVFDGSGATPWRESDATGPLGVYGKTKLAGEHAIAEFGCRHLIFRTSWVYATRGNNFAKTMLRLAKERSTLDVVNDQTGAPTGADLIADITAHAIRCATPEKSGTYHLAAHGSTDWASYARMTIAEAHTLGVETSATADRVRGIPSSAYPTPAKRPLNSRLDTSKLSDAFGLTLPDWRVGVRRMIAEHVGRG